MPDLPTLTLTGSGATGIRPQPFRGALAAASLPQQIKLGALLPATPSRALRLEAFLDRTGVTPKPSVNWYGKSSGLSRMMMNDRLGCCVITGKAHLICAQTAEDSDSGGEVIATDAEIVSQYNAWKAGPGDSGCIIEDVLRQMAAGFRAAGQLKRLKGYVAAGWQDPLIVKVGLDLFGGGTIGFRVPEGWLNSSVWSPQTATGRIVGGHDVTPLGYDDKGVYVSSWGRIYLFTWDAYLSTRWITEQYFLVFEDTWTGPDGVAPSGVDLNALHAALEKIRNGDIPPLPEPTPPPAPPSPPVPPSPPTPPNPTHPALSGPVSLHLPLFGTVTGVVGPLVPAPAPAAVGAADVKWFALMIDVARLVRAVQAQDWVAAQSAALAVLSDLGISLAAGCLGQTEAAGLTVDVWTLIGHVGALLEAIGSRDVPAVIAAIRTVLADLGITLPF